MNIREVHYFAGSTTAVVAFQQWFNGGEFSAGPIHTCDIRDLSLPCGTLVKPGETIGKTTTGEFVKVDISSYVRNRK